MLTYGQMKHKLVAVRVILAADIALKWIVNGMTAHVKAVHNSGGKADIAKITNPVGFLS